MPPAGAEPRDARVLVTMSDMPYRVLVVGLGSPDRGDDAVGAVVAASVARALADQGRSGVLVVEHEDPTALVHLMDATGPEGHTGMWDRVVVIDAVRTGAPPGTMTRLEVGSGEPGLRDAGARIDPGPAGTHGFGLAGAIELARALDRLPQRVVVIGIEADCFDYGAPLSAAVGAAVPLASEAVLSAVLEAAAAGA